MAAMLAALAAGAPPGRAAAASGAGSQVQVTPADGRDYQQPALAIDPRHSGHLALAYQGLSGGDARGGVQQRVCGLALSADGGGTWSASVLIGTGGRTPVPGGDAACWNPSVAYGPDGTLYYLMQTSRAATNPRSQVLLTVARDGGASFTTPRAVDPSSPAYPPDTRAGGDWWPQMSVDRRSGRLYVTWSRFTPDLDASRILVASSAAGGAGFSQPVRVSPPEQWDVTGPTATVGPDGSVDIVWLDYTQWERGNVSAACGDAGCSDGGYTVAQRVQALHDLYTEEGVRFDFTQGVGCEGFTAMTELDRTIPGPFAARGGECDLPGLVQGADSVDDGGSFHPMSSPGTPVYLGCFVGDNGEPPPSPPFHVCDRTHYSTFDHNLSTAAAGASPGQLLAAWWNDGTPDAAGTARLSVATSADRGGGWRTVTPVGMLAGGAGDEQHRPALSVAPGGRVDLAYYDLTPSGQQHTYWTWAPRPGGAFATPVRLDERPADSGVGPFADDFRASFGDHLAVASMDRAALVAWTGTGSSHQAIMFAAVAVPTGGVAGARGGPGLALVPGVAAVSGVLAIGAGAAAALALRRRRRATAAKRTRVSSA